MLYSHESNVPSPPANEPDWYVHKREGGGGRREEEEAEEERKGGEWKGVKRSGPKKCLQLNQATIAPTCLVSSLPCLSTVQETVMTNMRKEVHMRAGHHRGIVSLPSPGHSAG